MKKKLMLFLFLVASGVSIAEPSPNGDSQKTAKEWAEAAKQSAEKAENSAKK
ncbi:hypothetical protein [uncultured Sneathia sp.]|uniref:hypothetical protein n=1 Tax=uncultured Sneathia sp. TaxID=278067 RepID=UPI0025912D3A|nr:hypothetical protein [uncultured Sneathia sp.]